MALFHQLHRFSGVFDNSGWPQRTGGYRNTVCIAQERKKRGVFEILVPNPAFPKADIQKEQPRWNHSVALWAETHWLWPFCHLSLNKTHPDNKAASMPQLFSSEPTLQQVQSTIHHLSIHYYSLFTWDFLQHHKRDTKKARMFICVGPTKTVYQIGENVHVQMKLSRCYHITPVTRWHEVMCFFLPFSVT